MKMDDGTQVEYGPGDAFHMPPGQLHCNRFPSNPIHSVPGTQRTSKWAQPMSALMGKADIAFFGREGENAI